MMERTPTIAALLMAIVLLGADRVFPQEYGSEVERHSGNIPPESRGFPAQDRVLTPASVRTQEQVIRTGGEKPIGLVQVTAVPPAGPLPDNLAAGAFADRGAVWLYEPRTWSPSVVAWCAPGVCFRLLTFEEVNVERYGFSAGLLQPSVSTAHFFAAIVTSPWNLVTLRSLRCNYPLGYGRPGDCVPLTVGRLR